MPGPLVLRWVQDSRASEQNTEDNNDLLEVWVVGKQEEQC